MIYTLYKTNGEMVYIEESKPIELKKMQELVGGYIEFTRVFNKRDLHFCVNEEGRINNLPVNKMFPQYVGDIILGRIDKNGEFIGVG